LAVHYLCTRVKGPSEHDERKLERVLGFLKGTIDRSRIINKDGGIGKITAYVDASFSVHADGKGQSGAIIMMGSTMLEGITGKQKCASHDSTESELIALCDLSMDALWHHEWFENQGYKMEIPTVYQDNTSTIRLVDNGGGKMRTRHMRAKQAVVKERIDLKYFSIEYINTKEMIADILTKPLESANFHKFATIILGTIKMITDGTRRLKLEGVRWRNRVPDNNQSNGKPKA
jgi:hypothetical protein